ncbi:sodium:glutamate symporter [Shewanella corallii]|uniref:Sodium:glutamate symporter n=1 Tax=Shewanella corallii TaxID=560080 RepID=A0ABT0NAY6_9GAMM|nr:sodium:glutamate symporter [Shewanella corallii]MCL2915627.1 sodium:glutamate symporter [Shewanella corallii]
MTEWVMLTDFALAGALLLAGKILRIYCPPLQRLYLPAAVLAGIIGLFLGPSGLNILPWSQGFATNASLLTAALFAALGLTTDLPSPRLLAQRAGSLWAFNQVATVSQWLFAALMGLIMATFIWPELNPGFGLVLSAGFMGGHGTSVVVGNIFGQLGWADAMTLGLTFATAGVFISISLGMVILQAAVKFGLVKDFTCFDKMDSYQQKGLIAPSEQQPVMRETLSALSVDSFAIHLAIVAGVTAFAYHSANYLSSFMGQMQIPNFVTAFIGGMLVRAIAKRTGGKRYLCDKVFSHAGATTTDFLIVFGISAIKITVLTQYLLPMILLLTGGILFTLFLVLWVAPRMLGEDWFEKGIFSWGWLTGTVAMGIALLRVIDPKMKGTVLDDYAIAYVPGSITDVFIISMMPIAMVKGYQAEAFLVGFGYLALVLALWYWLLRRKNQPGIKLQQA